MFTPYVKSLFSVAVLAVVAGCATPPPPVSYDGLHLSAYKDFDQLYLKPGIDLGQYQAVQLEHCDVAFRADWLRSQNSNRGVGRPRVTEDDMEVIKARLSESCDKHFLEALAEAPAYPMVESATGNQPVLVIRPSIIDLDIRAPDLNDPGMTTTYTTSSGEMTLFLEIFDGSSGEILGRVVDEKEDFDNMQLEWTNRATNMADANRYLRSWTKSLRKGLDAARAAP